MLQQCDGLKPANRLMEGIFEGVSRLGLKKWSPLNMELPDAYKTGTIFLGAHEAAQGKKIFP